MWGSGKSILSSLIGSMNGVEKKRLDHSFEYLCIGFHLGRMSLDFAATLMRIYADLDQYNNIIGREVNLRPNDDSGFRNTPQSLRYLFRLFGPEGDEIVEIINTQNRALLLVTHHITAIREPLVTALGNRLFLIDVVRHPLQLVKYWTRYFSDFDRSREFTLSALVGATRVPWFAINWSEEFVSLSPIDRAIRCINQIQSASLASQASSLGANDQATAPKTLMMPFERLITDTDLVLDEVATFLGRTRTRWTRAALRRQKVPRDLSEPGNPTNSRSWLPNGAISYRQQLADLARWVSREATQTSISLMGEAIERYETRFASSDFSTRC